MVDKIEGVFTSETINQHYLSQVEQRFNSCNKNASQRNKKINIFSIGDVRSLKTKAASVEKKISKSLMEHDLFSIRTSKHGRLNLENLMGPLESAFSDSVNDLIGNKTIGKDSDEENLSRVKKILSLKMMSTFRNPYYISRTLKIINFGVNFILDSNEHLAALINLYKKENNIARLSKEFNVTEQQYTSWINTLIALLLTSEKDGCIIEGMIDEIFLAEEFFHSITLYTYDDNLVLLPETGMHETADYHSLTYFINLSSTSFLMIHSNVLSDLGNMKISPKLYEHIIEKCGREDKAPEYIDKMRGKKIFSSAHNNYQMLKIFNTNCVRSAKKYILFSQPKIDDELLFWQAI